MRKFLLILTLLVSLLAHQVEAKKYALLIAVQDYPGVSGWTTLHSRNDIALLKKPLEESGFKVYTLIDKEATHQGILNAIGNIPCAQGDMVWIHFSGHGQQMPDVVGDETDHKTEAFIPYDARKRASSKYKGENHLTDDEIKDALIPIRNRLTAKGHLLVTFDACHSADGSRGDEEFNETDTLVARGSDVVFELGKHIVRKNKLAKDAASVIEISACGSTETNYEYKNQCGSLSYLFAMGIKKQGRKINFMKLAQYVINKKNYRSIMPRQTPQRQVY